LAGISGIVTFFWTRPKRFVTPVESTVQGQGVTHLGLTLEQREKMARAAFYDEQVQPCIGTADARNREAAERVVKSLRSQFAIYRGGVHSFVQDLTSLGTRWEILKRMSRQLLPESWRDEKTVEAYVRKSFETHLFSEVSFVNDVGGVMSSFRSDIEANQRRLLVDIRAALEIADLPKVTLASYDQFSQSVSNKLQSFSNKSIGHATKSVYHALIVLIISEAGSQVVRSMIAGTLARIGATAAASTAAAGGATAGGATIGAGGGSFGGPIGSLVGLGVGLAVGLLIDWWMTGKFQKDIALEMDQYLTSIEESILGGSQQQSHSNEKVGLVGTLPVICDQLKTIYQDRFYHQIVAGEVL
jgi:hypothetical protein